MEKGRSKLLLATIINFTWSDIVVFLRSSIDFIFISVSMGLFCIYGLWKLSERLCESLFSSEQTVIKLGVSRISLIGFQHTEGMKAIEAP